MNKIVGKNIRNERLNRGWSMEFLARQIGCCKMTISRLENGQGIRQNTLKKICSILQIQIQNVYKEPKEKVEEIEFISQQALSKLIQNSVPLIKAIEHETVAQYVNLIKKDATMVRSDIEKLLEFSAYKRKTYNLLDVITISMLVNQETIKKISNLRFNSTQDSH